MEFKNVDPVPTEMWFKIFSYIDHIDDIKNLSLVCTLFHEIIGKSPEAMNKLMLRLHANMTQHSQDIILESPRNYSRIRLFSFQFEYQLSEFFKIPEKFGSYLKELEMIGCDLIEKELIDILKLTKNNLTKLIIFSTKIDKISHAHENFKLEKLENLQVENVNCDIFSILLDHLVPDTLDLINFRCYFNQQIGTSFTEVLEKQKNLKHLEIVFSGPFTVGFNAVRFGLLKLESLRIGNHDPNVPSEEIYHFIKSQQASLRSLFLMNLNFQNYSDIFESMPNLERLDIGNIASWSSFASGRNYYCPSLKKFSLWFFDFYNTRDVSNFTNMIKRFANLNELVLKTQVNSAILLLVAQCHPNLKKIQFNNFTDDALENVVFQKVEELTISSISKEGKKFSDSNMDFVGYAMPNLKIIRILGEEQINSKSLIWLLIHFTKLEHLEIENGSELKYLWQMTDYFRDLKFLRISNYEGMDIKQFRQQLRHFPALFFRVTPKRPVSEYPYILKHNLAI